MSFARVIAQARSSSHTLQTSSRNHLPRRFPSSSWSSYSTATSCCYSQQATLRSNTRSARTGVLSKSVVSTRSLSSSSYASYVPVSSRSFATSSSISRSRAGQDSMDVDSANGAAKLIDGNAIAK